MSRKLKEWPEGLERQDEYGVGWGAAGGIGQTPHRLSFLGKRLTASLLACLDISVSRWSDASVCRSRSSVVRFISRISCRLFSASETCTTCGRKARGMLRRGMLIGQN